MMNLKLILSCVMIKTTKVQTLQYDTSLDELMTFIQGHSLNSEKICAHFLSNFSFDLDEI